MHYFYRYILCPFPSYINAFIVMKRWSAILSALPSRLIAVVTLICMIELLSISAGSMYTHPAFFSISYHLISITPLSVFKPNKDYLYLLLFQNYWVWPNSLQSLIYVKSLVQFSYHLTGTYLRKWLYNICWVLFFDAFAKFENKTSFTLTY